MLRGLVRLSCLHILRCERRRRAYEHTAGVERLEPCCDQDPLLELAAGEACTRIEQRVAALPEEFARVFELYAQDGLEYAEIARVLRLPIGTVRSRIHRARAQLSRCTGREE